MSSDFSQHRKRGSDQRQGMVTVGAKLESSSAVSIKVGKLQ